MFKTVQESQTLLINNQSKILESENRSIIKFGFGQSPFLPPTNVVKALEKASTHKEYSCVQGDLRLRQLMSIFHKAHNGLEVLPENILTAPGSKILLFNILLAFEKADVFIPSPAWVSYAPQVELVKHNAIRLHTNFEERWRVTPEVIEDAVKNKIHKHSVLILNYPGNPDGLTYSDHELKALAVIARKHGVYVILDEIYGLLNHELDHKSFAIYYPEKTITTTGLSKWCGAGGWRFGAAFLPNKIDENFKKALISIGSETYSCAPMPVQIAAREAYANYNDTKPYLSRQVSVLSEIGNYCSQQLNEANVRTHHPDGGFYLFPDFMNYKEILASKGIQTSNDLCQNLLKDTGVALLPSTAFGFEDNYLAARLAYVDFMPLQEETVFDLDKHAPNVVEGIKLIMDWIKSF